MFSSTRPEAPYAFAAAVRDCGGVHGAHQHARGLLVSLSVCRDL